MKTQIRGLIAAAMLATTSCVVLAQAHTAPFPDPAASPSANRSASHYQSAFDSYRRYSDQKVQPWRQANDLVGRIGGWQTYARESAGQEAAMGHGVHPSGSNAAAGVSTPAAGASAPSPASVRAPAKAPALMPHHTPHGGHAMPQRP